MKSARIALGLATLLGLTGCSTVEGIDYNLVVAMDEGTLCMLSGEPLMPGTPAAGSELLTFDEGSQLHVTVSLDDCLSDSCDVNRTAVCQVTQDGATLQVSSELSYEAFDEAQCTMDCGRLVARCQSAPLSAGHYKVEFGADTYGLSVPSTVTAACR
ncbi:MAG: hypothetical protein JRI68_29660 [Deltaproteobacteria bacterium]|nr:hypothetical protein [Deltaproteobacteria bacterium]